MKRIVLKYGLISGAVVAVLMAVNMALAMKGIINFKNAEVSGYTAIVLSFLVIFLGIRSYRDNVGNGGITFGRAFKVGILITLISCAIYVVTWEIVYFNFLPNFEDTYAALTLDQMREKGASAAQIAETEKKMAEFKLLYKNPLFNVGMTFMEVFPVGLIMTLVSAGILRRRSAPATPVVAVA